MKVYIVESVFWDAYSDTLILLKKTIWGKEQKGMRIMSRNSSIMVYHRPECRYAGQIRKKNQIKTWLRNPTASSCWLMLSASLAAAP